MNNTPISSEQNIENNLDNKLEEKDETVISITNANNKDERLTLFNKSEESEINNNIINNNDEKTKITKYDRFKAYVMEKGRVDLSFIKLGKMSIIEAVAFFTNCLIFPAIYFQMYQTWNTSEAADIDISFNTLQLVGGTPEGAIGVIIGYLIKSTQMMAIGALAVFFRAFLNFYICFGKKGIVKDLYTKKGKK
jgi:hypothetical protein